MIYVKRSEKDLSFVKKPEDFLKRVSEEDAQWEDYKIKDILVRKVKKKKKPEDPVEYEEVKPEYTCYKNDDLKKKLIEIFQGKCAYCDSTIVHISAGDVEHFRPKSKYWWMAAKWDNLLFACEKCNRTGKIDKFPLLDEDFKYNYNEPEKFDEEEKNYRLLINPCIENPENYFEYHEKEGVIKVNPSIAGDEKKKKMADISIEVYALQRPELVQERQKLLILLFAQMEMTEKAIEQLKKHSDITSGLTKHLQEKLRRELELLLRYNQSKRQYLGMVRQVLRKFFLKYGITMDESLKTLD